MIETLNRLAQSWWEYAAAVSVQVAVVFILVGALCLLFRRAPAAWRHALWLLVFVKLLLPPTLALPFSPGDWFARSLPAPVVEVVNLQRPAPPVEDAPPIAPAVMVAAKTAPTPRLSGATLLLVAWACGVFALTMALVARLVVHRRRVRRAEEVADPDVLAQLAACRERLGLSRRVRLVVSNECDAPSVGGLLSPVILLPARWLEDRPNLAPVFLHELSHVRRGDVFLSLFSTLLLCAWWFHPLVWFAQRQLWRERERACDDAVLAYGAEPGAYAQSLVELARYATGHATVWAGLLGMAEQPRHDLVRRVQRIFDPKRRGLARLGWARAAACAALAAIVLPLAATGQKSPEPPTQEPQDHRFVSVNVRWLALDKPGPLDAPSGLSLKTFDGKEVPLDARQLRNLTTPSLAKFSKTQAAAFLSSQAPDPDRLEGFQLLAYGASAKFAATTTLVYTEKGERKEAELGLVATLRLAASDERGLVVEVMTKQTWLTGWQRPDAASLVPVVDSAGTSQISDCHLRVGEVLALGFPDSGIWDPRRTAGQRIEAASIAALPPQPQDRRFSCLLITPEVLNATVAWANQRTYPLESSDTFRITPRQFEIEARIIQLPAKRNANDPTPADTNGRILSSTELAQTLAALSTIPEAEVLSAPRMITNERPYLRSTPRIHVITQFPYVTRTWVDAKSEVQADLKNLEVGVVLETVPARLPDGRIQVDFATVLGCVMDRRPIVVENPSGAVLTATQEDKYKGLGVPVVDEKSLSREVALQSGETYAVQLEGYEPGLHERLLHYEPPLRARPGARTDRLFLFLTVHHLGSAGEGTPPPPRPEEAFFRRPPNAAQKAAMEAAAAQALAEQRAKEEAEAKRRAAQTPASSNDAGESK